jgi:SpoIID/LytB domain protein
MGLLAGGAVLVSGLPRRLLASDLSLSDRIDLLYTNQFQFNARGRPQVTIGLMEGQSEVLLSSQGLISALPSGDGGTSIEGGHKWRIRLEQGKPADQSFRIALEAVPAQQVRAIDKAAKRWRKLGFEVTEQEVGALFGVDGKMLDTRRVLLTTGKFSSENEALTQARVLKQRHAALGLLHPEVHSRGRGRIVAEDLEKNIRVRAEGVLWFGAAENRAMTVHDVVYETTNGHARETRGYHGQIYAAVDRHGKLSIVNLVDEADILAGLVPAEIFASAPEAALEAQAIAARGQLLAKIGTRHLDDPYLLCAHQHCQVYAGASKETDRTTAAVTRTIGRLLMRPDGTQLVDTVYSANSGGHTEHNELVWPSAADPQLRGRPDPKLDAEFAKGVTAENIEDFLRKPQDSFSKPSEHLMSAYRWKHGLDPAVPARDPALPKGFGKLQAIEVIERGRSGRAIKVRLRSNRAEVTVEGELRIRKALGNLRSSLFVVEPERDANGHFQLVGAGHGHGVGMCQHGAMGMAAAGKTHEEILAHYYPGSLLEKLW